MHTDFAFICLEFTWVAFCFFFCFFRFLLTYIQSNHIFAACCYRKFYSLQLYNILIFIICYCNTENLCRAVSTYALCCNFLLTFLCDALLQVVFFAFFYILPLHCCKLYCVSRLLVLSAKILIWKLAQLIAAAQLVGIACAGIVCAGHPTATSGREFDSLYVCACVFTVMSVK